MANKIISFGNIKKPTDNKESNSNLDNHIVFKDISMIAKYVNNTLQHQYNPSTEFISILKTEAPQIDEALYDDIYTLFLLQFRDDPNPTVDNVKQLLKKISIYHIDKLINIQAILNSLHNIFTWRPGERILNPEFGSRLYTLLYEGITPETEERIAAEIRSCVSEWEPRVQIVEIRDISTIDETEDNTIRLEVVFIIPQLSDEQYKYGFVYHRSEV